MKERDGLKIVVCMACGGGKCKESMVHRKEEGEGLKDETLRELREEGREGGKEGREEGTEVKIHQKKRYGISMVCLYSSLKAVLSAVPYLIFNPNAK